MKVRIRHNTAAKRLKVGGKPAPRVEIDDVASALGAIPVSNGTVSKGSPINFFVLRREMIARMESTGGRPSLSGATRRQKVSLQESEWQCLVHIADELKLSGLKVTPGQVAGMLLRQVLEHIQYGHKSKGFSELVDLDPNDQLDLPLRVLMEVA